MSTTTSSNNFPQNSAMGGHRFVLNGKAYKTLHSYFAAIKKHPELGKRLMRPKRKYTQRIQTGIPRSAWCGKRIKFDDRKISNEDRAAREAEKEVRKAARLAAKKQREEDAKRKSLEKQARREAREAAKFKRENDAAVKKSEKLRKLQEKSAKLAEKIHRIQDTSPPAHYLAAVTTQIRNDEDDDYSLWPTPTSDWSATLTQAVGDHKAIGHMWEEFLDTQPSPIHQPVSTDHLKINVNI